MLGASNSHLIRLLSSDFLRLVRLDLETLSLTTLAAPEWDSEFLAASAGGQSLVQELAQLTRADVAASTDLTGAAALGGDWDLEVRRGAIETRIIGRRRTQKSPLYSGKTIKRLSC